MKSGPSIVCNERAVSRAHKHSGRRSNAVRHINHEIINHLSVITSSCFRLRELFSQAPGAAHGKDIAAIEIAVQEVADQADNLSRLFQDNRFVEENASSYVSTKQAAADNKVCTISPYLKTR